MAIELPGDLLRNVGYQTAACFRLGSDLLIARPLLTQTSVQLGRQRRHTLSSFLPVSATVTSVKQFNQDMAQYAHRHLGISAPFSLGHTGPLPGAPRFVDLGTHCGHVMNGVITAVGNTPQPSHP